MPHQSMDHSIVHIEMAIKGIIHEFCSKIHGFYDFKNLQNNFVHHVDIQFKIFETNPFKSILKPIK
jgi:hypothetical protein